MLWEMIGFVRVGNGLEVSPARAGSDVDEGRFAQAAGRCSVCWTLLMFCQEHALHNKTQDSDNSVIMHRKWLPWADPFLWNWRRAPRT